MNEARLWALIVAGMEHEGIRPVKVHSMYNVMTDSYDVRVDHIPSKVSVAHNVWSSKLDLPGEKLIIEVVDPIVTKMLEALTS